MIVPAFPSIGDAALLFQFWDNGIQVDTESTSTDPLSTNEDEKKPVSWAAMERLGDTWIRTISQEELPNIFGSRNYALINFLTEHANSNKFFDKVARCYELDRRVRIPPRRKRIKDKKGCADLFEAWIGFHVLEQRLYNQNDPLHELRYFLNKLWSLRYRELKTYACHPSLNRTNILPVGIDKTPPVKINWPDDQLLKKNLPSLNKDTQNREIGYLVSSTSARDTPLLEFIPFTSKVDELTTLKIGDDQGTFPHFLSDYRCRNSA